mgnify:CR=1 FL=1
MKTNTGMAEHGTEMQGGKTTIATDLAEALDVVEAFVRRSCSQGHYVDSMASETWHPAIHLLTKHGRIKISQKTGDRIFGQWIN